MNIRERIEELEIKNLSAYAVKSRFSLGRGLEEEPCEIRTCFQRDRDRIIHSKAFRRLMHKTQVFISPDGENENRVICDYIAGMTDRFALKTYDMVFNF